MLKIDRRTFLEQEQRLCVVALLDHVVPGGHDQRGQPGSHQARAGVVQRLEDVAAATQAASGLPEIEPPLPPDHASVCPSKRPEKALRAAHLVRIGALSGEEASETAGRGTCA